MDIDMLTIKERPEGYFILVPRGNVLYTSTLSAVADLFAMGVDVRAFGQIGQNYTLDLRVSDFDW